MNLKEQIEKTIEVYKKGCKIKNLNLKYCIEKRIASGLCFYCAESKLLELQRVINYAFYICETPVEVFNNKKIFFKKIHLYKAHQTRIKYLQNLLTNIQK
jgi:hypothetical protein